MRRIFTLTGLFILFQVSAQKLTLDDPLIYLALGDSYTIGQSVPVDQRWPVQLVEALRSELGIDSASVDIIAQTGWTTGNLRSAIDNFYDESKNYNLVSLLIGVNNQYQKRPIEDYAPEFSELLDIAIQIAGGEPDRVFVVSIPDYSYTPSHANYPGISAEINEYNRINKEETIKRGVRYFDITAISRKGLTIPGYVANDGLHPSGLQYKEWVNKIVYEIVNPTATGVFELSPDSALSYMIENGSLKVSLPEPGGLITLIDVNGRILSKQEGFDRIVEMDTRTIDPGIYILDYLYDNRRQSQAVYID